MSKQPRSFASPCATMFIFQLPFNPVVLYVVAHEGRSMKHKAWQRSSPYPEIDIKLTVIRIRLEIKARSDKAGFQRRRPVGVPMALRFNQILLPRRLGAWDEYAAIPPPLVYCATHHATALQQDASSARHLAT